MNKTKAIILVEGDPKECFDLADEIEPQCRMYVDTIFQNEIPELEVIMNVVEEFMDIPIDYLIIRYSGDEDIAREIGDVYPGIIISLSYNADSEYYVDKPVEVFSMFIDSINKEKLNGIRA